MFKIVKNKKKGLCRAYGCTSRHTPKNRLCSKHRKRRQKENNPISYTYNALKNNAKRRGKEFGISLEEFRKFCEKTGYLENKGRMSTSATIDRIDPSRGYVPGNIQVLNNGDNVKKYHDNNSNCPF